MKKFLIYLLLFLCLAGTFPTTISAGGRWVDLGSGWKIRLDPPVNTVSNKWHVHVENSNGSIKASENVDGTKHDGGTLDKLPKKIREKARKSKTYKKGKENQKKTNAAKSQIKKNGLNARNSLHWAAIIAILVLFGIAVYFSGGAALAALAV